MNTTRLIAAALLAVVPCLATCTNTGYEWGPKYGGKWYVDHRLQSPSAATPAFDFWSIFRVRAYGSERGTRIQCRPPAIPTWDGAPECGSPHQPGIFVTRGLY